MAYATDMLGARLATDILGTCYLYAAALIQVCCGYATDMLLGLLRMWCGYAIGHLSPELPRLEPTWVYA